MTKQISTILTLTLAALCFTGAASAQTGGGASADQQQAQQLMQEYRQKATTLQEIHTETIEANPDLAEQQAEFESEVREAVEDQGYDIETGQERIQSLAGQLQEDSDLSEEERQAVMQDFAAERRSLQQARAAALEQPEIQEAGQKLQQDTMAAMQEQSPQTEQLMQEMQSLRSELQAAMPAQGAPGPNTR